MKKISKDLLELGENYAQKRNLGFLHNNEQLPFGYFNPIRLTGKIDIPGNAREKKNTLK